MFIAPSDPLLEDVLKLTTRHVESAQVAGDSRWHYVKQDALLRQLRDAIVADVGGPSGGSLPHERLPLDRDALEKYLDLTNRIRDWHELVLGHRADIRENPEVTLSRAYSEHAIQVAGKTADKIAQKVALTLCHSAVAMIIGKLQPPTTMELFEDSCPECGFSWFNRVVNKGESGVDAHGKRRAPWFDIERAVALTVSYKPDGLGGLSKSYARCGCCETFWPEASGIRELAYALEHPELIEQLEETAAQDVHP